MNNNQKRHFHTNSDVSTNQVFTLLDAVWSDNKDEVDKLTNDFDTKFIAPEEIKLIGNPSNVNALTLETNTHVVDQGPTYTKELETNKKRKKKQNKVSQSNGKATFLHIILKNIVFLMAELSTNLMKVLQFSILMNKLLMMFWLRHLRKLDWN